MTRPESRGRWLLLGLLLALLTIFSLSLFLIPGFIIRPFGHQSQEALALAIAVKRIAPGLTLAALVGVLALGWRLWRNSSRTAAGGHRDGAGAQRGIGGDGPAELL